jgi:hypothetical protein
MFHLNSILNELLGVSLPAVGSGFTLVVLKMEKPFLKATAAIPNAFRFADIKNSSETFPFFCHPERAIF